MKKCYSCRKIDNPDKANSCLKCGNPLTYDSASTQISITQDPKVTKPVAIKEGKEHIIFISHAEADKEIVRYFREMLDLILYPYIFKYKFFCTSKIGDIECGDDIREKIHDKLNRSENVFCILTRQSCDRTWVIYEIGYTKGKSSDENKKKLIPIAIGISRKEIINQGYPYSNIYIYECNEESISALIIQFIDRIIPSYSEEKQVDKLNKSFAPHIKEFLNKIKNNTDSYSGKKCPKCETIGYEQNGEFVNYSLDDYFCAFCTKSKLINN